VSFYGSQGREGYTLASPATFSLTSGASFEVVEADSPGRRSVTRTSLAYARSSRQDDPNALPSGASDEACEFVILYLALVPEVTPLRNHDVREVFIGLRLVLHIYSP